MLKNTNVLRVSLNTEEGLCKIYMDNGERYQCDDILYPEDFKEYIDMLKDEDEMSFQSQTVWQLTTNDNWSEWKQIFEYLGVWQVIRSNLNGVKQIITLKEVH